MFDDVRISIETRSHRSQWVVGWAGPGWERAGSGGGGQGVLNVMVMEYHRVQPLTPMAQWSSHPHMITITYWWRGGRSNVIERYGHHGNPASDETDRSRCVEQWKRRI